MNNNVPRVPHCPALWRIHQIFVRVVLTRAGFACILAAVGDLCTALTGRDWFLRYADAVIPQFAISISGEARLKAQKACPVGSLIDQRSPVRAPERSF